MTAIADNSAAPRQATVCGESTSRRKRAAAARGARTESTGRLLATGTTTYIIIGAA